MTLKTFSHEMAATRFQRVSGFARLKTQVLRGLGNLLAVLACGWAMPAAALPDYLSYYAMGRYTEDAIDHVNLYWVYGDWNRNEAFAQLADAKSLALPALVHTEFVFFEGPFQSAWPRFTLRPDAAARWAAFVEDLQARGLLATMVAVYPCDEPDLNGVGDGELQQIIGIVKAHPLSADKSVAAIFSAEIAQKWGGKYALLGQEHPYRTSLRMLDWVGFDCYECSNIFTEPLWHTLSTHGLVDGPSAYANFRRQLDLPRQRIMLVPQSYLSTVPDANGNFDPPDDPEMFFTQAQNDPAVVALAPFTWFDMPGWLGAAHVPVTLSQYRSIGQRIASARATPPGTVVEYVIGSSDLRVPGEHYFYTNDAGEQKQLDSPASGFVRTGQSFKAYPLNTLGTANTCRFYTALLRSGTHFFTPIVGECADLKTSHDWIYEGEAFAVAMPTSAGSCPVATKPLYRLYKNSEGGVPNHRLTTRFATRAAMLGQHWIAEGYGVDGVVSCVAD